jgi:hypothetical protein
MRKFLTIIIIQFTDITPPMVTGCHEDIHVNATEQTIEYSWTEPQFSDSRGSSLDIVTNYPTPEFTFPWGDFTVQYVATKTSNGLRTECSFKIKVRRKYLLNKPTGQDHTILLATLLLSSIV